METQNNQTNISIVDSSILVSLFSQDDAYHAHAQNLTEQAIKEEVVILVSDSILVETVNILGKKFGHKLTIEAADFLINSDSFLIVETNIVLSQALEKFKNSNEKVSLTDCIVMATADKFNTKNILGFDDDFRDHGYQVSIP